MSSIRNKKGFSFLEVMITIAVLSAGILAALTLVANSIGNAMKARDSIIASSLAQEGVELVRNIRDNNYLTDPSDPFVDLIDGDNYSISYDTPLSSGVSYRLNDVGGFYSHSAGGTSTKFYRKIKIDTYDADASEKMITGVVWWDGNANDPADCVIAKKCVHVEDVLTEWR